MNWRWIDTAAGPGTGSAGFDAMTTAPQARAEAAGED